MTSIKQIEANRRNSLKSTGPKTEAGKQASRCNAVRHGLTAETVIGVLEDAEDYKGFEAAITADYDAQSAVERELVLRLAPTTGNDHRDWPFRNPGGPSQ
jgi:fructose/tagatose bisphosphate aldolase